MLKNPYGLIDILEKADKGRPFTSSYPLPFPRSPWQPLYLYIGIECAYVVTGTPNASMRIYRLVPGRGCYVRLSSGSGRQNRAWPPIPRTVLVLAIVVNPNEAEATRDSARILCKIHCICERNCMRYLLNPPLWFMTSSSRVPFTTVNPDFIHIGLVSRSNRG